MYCQNLFLIHLRYKRCCLNDIGEVVAVKRFYCFKLLMLETESLYRFTTFIEMQILVLRLPVDSSKADASPQLNGPFLDDGVHGTFEGQNYWSTCMIVCSLIGTCTKLTDTNRKLQW